MKDVPYLKLVEADHEYRIMACRTPDNGCYCEKLVILALPNITDDRNSVVGQLVVSTDADDDTIDWIGVAKIDRRKGIGRRMWKAAEQLLGRELMHDPVTDLGEKFAEAMERETTKGTQP